MEGEVQKCQLLWGGVSASVITDDFNLQAAIYRLHFLMKDNGCHLLDSRQAETIARHINKMQERIDDLEDALDAATSAS